MECSAFVYPHQDQTITRGFRSYRCQFEIESGFDIERQADLMTYQVTLCGRDGVVVASDRCQVWQETMSQSTCWTKSKVRKIFTDAAGKMAWTFSGGHFSDVTARYLRDFLADKPDYDEQKIESAIRDCGSRACEAFHTLVKANLTDILVLVSGVSGQILRAQISRMGTTVERLENKQCVSGITDSFVNFFPNHFCDAGDMSVDQLAQIAAYCVCMAHREDSRYVDGLDLAIYRNSEKCFKFVDGDFYWQEALKLDDALRQFLKSRSW
jgi:20S proteasome alpha/beta subunit